MVATHYKPSTFKTSRSVGFKLRIAHAAMLDLATEAFAGHHISFVQWLVMMKIHEGGTVSASDICRLMRHDNGAFTRLLDHLEERGLIRRKRSDSDRRIVDLSLTAAGRREVAELVPRAVNSMNEGLAGLSKAELAQLTGLLDKLIASVRACAVAAAERP